MDTNSPLNDAKQHQTLEQIMDWCAKYTSSVEIVAMIAQDEFSMDLVVSIQNQYLVYDVT